MIKKFIGALAVEPQPKQEWNSEGTEVIEYEGVEEEHWLELFADLVFVAFLINLGTSVSDCLSSFWAIVRVLKYFLIFVSCRLSLEEYANRFFGDDILHRALYFVYTFGLLFIAANTHWPPDNGIQHRALAAAATQYAEECQLERNIVSGFIVGQLITKLASMAIYGYIMVFNKKAKTQFSYTIGIHILSTIVIIVSLGLSFSYESYPDLNLDRLTSLQAGSAFIEIFGRFLQPYIQKYFHQGRFIFFPMNVATVQSRLGIFILIVLGESFVGLITVDPNLGDLKRVYSFLFCALMLIFSLAISFFDAVHRNNFDALEHAMVRSKVAGTVWQLLHIPLGFCLFLTGVGLKESYHSVVSNQVVNKVGADLVSYACGSATICFAIMRALHKGLLGKDKGTPLSLTDKMNRFFLYSLYAIIAMSHFLVVQRSSEQYERDFENEHDVFIYAHMTIALILAFLATNRVGLEQKSEDKQNIAEELSNKRFSAMGGLSLSPTIKQQNPRRSRKSSFSNKNLSFLGAEDLDCEGLRKNSFSVSLSSVPSLRDSASTAPVVDEEVRHSVRNPVRADNSVR